MIPIKGTPLIHYIQKRLLDKNFTNVHVACESSNRNTYVLSKINYIPSPKRFGKFYENSCIYHYRRFLNKNGVNIILFGDTYYTDAFIDALSKDTGETFHVYGRHDASTSITKNDRNNEKFAYVIHGKDIDDYIKICENAIPVMETIFETKQPNNVLPTCFPQLVYRKFVGYDWYDNRVDDKHWIEWNDLTDDFDYQNDLNTKRELFPQLFI